MADSLAPHYKNTLSLGELFSGFELPEAFVLVIFILIVV